MRKIIYLMLVSILAFTSCKEESINPVGVDTIPSPPALDAPKDTSFNIDLPVILKWNESKGAISYRLQVSSNSSFTTFIYDKKDIATTTQEIPELDYSSVYYWRVSASNSAGTSDWSKVWSFTTTDQSPAYVPNLSGPYKGAVNENLSPFLLWYRVGNVDYFSVEVSTNSSFTNLVYKIDSLTETRIQIKDLAEQRTYYWRVRAVNKYGSMGWTETWFFTTGMLPSVPVLSSPSDGAIGVSLPPIVTWNTSEGAQYYNLQVATDSSFSNLVIDDYVVVGTSTPILRLYGLTKYYWRIKGWNKIGYSQWSHGWSFTTQSVCGGITEVFYENKTYHTVDIGEQCWLKENLNVGTMIQSPVNMSDNGTLEKYCWNNNALNCDTYGGLYQWSEAMKYSSTSGTQGICPEGWHIPTTSEFTTLAIAVGQSGNALKAVGQGTGNGAGTNTSGFSAILSGFRGYNGYFLFFLGDEANIWSSTKLSDVYSESLYLQHDDNSLNSGSTIQVYGLSIRCIKDN